MSLLLLLVGASDGGAPAAPEGGGFVGAKTPGLRIVPEEPEVTKDDEFWWWE